MASTRRIGRYELEGKAGEGASGVVYRAYDRLLDRDCAIELARTNVLSEEEVEVLVARAMAKSEGDRFRSAAELAHDVAVVVYVAYLAAETGTRVDLGPWLWRRVEARIR